MTILTERDRQLLRSVQLVAQFPEQAASLIMGRLTRDDQLKIGHELVAVAGRIANDQESVPLIDDGVQYMDEMILGNMLNAIGSARRQTTCTLQYWRLPEPVVAKTGQVVEALIRDAVQATGNPSLKPKWTQIDTASVLVLRWRLDGQRLVIELQEPASPKTYQRLQAPIDSVAALCQRAGRYVPEPGGLVTWCELQIASAP